MNAIYKLPDTQWQGCYSPGWGRTDLVPEAFSHPAKLAKGLGVRIVEHAIANGWVKPGEWCADPFGGVATISLALNLKGINYVGCELEPRFVGLAQQNIDQWRRKYGAMPGFGSARILQGDSRKLASVIGALPTGEPPACIISSPPYAGIAAGACGLNHLPGKDGQQSGRSADSASQQADSHYGGAEGQLSTMREGEAPACIISSPPYAGSAIEKNSAGVDRVKQYETYRASGGGASYEGFCATQEKHSHHYGSEAAQLGAMPEGRFDAVVSSPPYETGGHHDHQMDSWNANWRGHGVEKDVSGYGDSPAQLAGHGDTFWQAAREIVAQCALILKPGGHAIWITKDFVRKGKRVPFSDQWQALCEQQGFKLVCRHQAMLVAHYGEQADAFGEAKELTTSRKSFFRRLAEKKGSPEINHEDIICMVKA